MSNNINVSLDNPYGRVTIPRAKLPDCSMVIPNPAVVTNENSYGNSSSGPEVREVEPEEPRGRACCYRCRRKK